MSLALISICQVASTSLHGTQDLRSCNWSKLTAITNTTRISIACFRFSWECMHEVCFKQVGENMSTIDTHRNADWLLKNSSPKQQMRCQSTTRTFWWNLFQNKMCPFPKDIFFLEFSQRGIFFIYKQSTKLTR